MSKSADKNKRRELEAQRLGISVTELKRRRAAEQQRRLADKAAAMGLTVEAYLDQRRASKESVPSPRRQPTSTAPGGKAGWSPKRAAPTSKRTTSAKGLIALRDAAPLVEVAAARKAAAEAKKVKQRQKRTGKGTTLTSKGPPTKTCRECLKTFSPDRFPNPRVPRCEDCGGQPPSRRVRTVSGGAPSLGRRR